MSSFDEMTPREVVAVGKKMIKTSLWPTTGRIRQDLVNTCFRFMEDEELKPATRMGAMQILMECEKQNLVREKMDADLEVSAGGGEENKGPKVVLLLPPNGSEKKEVADVD